MELALDLSAIPVRQLVPRRLRLGPFASGRDLVKFLCLATTGAAAAAVTSVVVWLPFLAAGAVLALVRVDGRTLDDYALGYCRFRRRASHGTTDTAAAAPYGSRSSRPRSHPSPIIRAGGIPIAYLPPADLHRLFDEWRSAVSAIDGVVGIRSRGELFSPLPFLPAVERPRGPERVALESYRELVRGLLRKRYRRVVEVMVRAGRSDGDAPPISLETQVEALLATLERLGIPTDRSVAGTATTARRGATVP